MVLPLLGGVLGDLLEVRPEQRDVGGVEEGELVALGKLGEQLEVLLGPLQRLPLRHLAAHDLGDRLLGEDAGQDRLRGRRVEVLVRVLAHRLAVVAE